jgi:prepilin-type N-terminal cleavage/methylation domain-containing protein
VRRSSSNSRRPTGSRAARGAESGFTLLEMMIAMVILLISLLSLGQVLGYALSVSNRGRGVTNAKLLVVSVLEQMENLRNTGQLTYGQIANSEQVDNEGATFNFDGFPEGFQPVPTATAGPGADGIYGTDDDPSTSEKVYAGFERQIEIEALGDAGNLKRIVVTLRYKDAGGQEREMTGTSYLNNDFRSNILR